MIWQLLVVITLAVRGSPAMMTSFSSGLFLSPLLVDLTILNVKRLGGTCKQRHFAKEVTFAKKCQLSLRAVLIDLDAQRARLYNKETAALLVLRNYVLATRNVLKRTV